MKLTSSFDFLNNVINPAREASGQNILRNNVFLDKIEDELEMDKTCCKTFVSSIPHQGGVRSVEIQSVTMSFLTRLKMKSKI